MRIKNILNSNYRYEPQILENVLTLEDVFLDICLNNIYNFTEEEARKWLDTTYADDGSVSELTYIYDLEALAIEYYEEIISYLSKYGNCVPNCIPIKWVNSLSRLTQVYWNLMTYSDCFQDKVIEKAKELNILKESCE